MSRQVLEQKRKLFMGHIQAKGPDMASQSSREQQKAPACPRGLPTAWNGCTWRCVFVVPKSAAQSRHKGQEDSG